MLPCTPPGTFRALVGRLSAKLGRPINVKGMPRWLLKTAAMFVPLMRELDEMLYQWDEPFVVDDSRFRARFGTAPATVDEAASATVAWANAHYASAPGGRAR
jgi:hypothetical protein